MSNLMHALQGGHYAKKQIFGKVALMSWSHKRRFQLALKLARQFAGKRILDYGSGDGTFLAMLMSEPFAPAEAIGGELYQKDVNECTARLSDIGGLRFVTIDRLSSEGRFDAIFCMEVLEHVVNQSTILDRLDGLMAPDGKLIVSVPVETGLPMVIKQGARQLAAFRGMKDYPGSVPYTWPEYFTSIVAGSKQHVVRPVHTGTNGIQFHDHKGFNWMALRKELGRRFLIENSLTSPVPWLPAHLGSQVWFVLKKKQP